MLKTNCTHLDPRALLVEVARIDDESCGRMSVCSSESVDSSDNEGNNTPCGRNRDVESVPEATPVLAEAFPTCRSVVKPLLRLAWPVAMASLCMALLPTVSLVFVGQLSQNALSAGGLAYSYTNVAGVRSRFVPPDGR
jgi:hypothetical protein